MQWNLNVQRELRAAENSGVQIFRRRDVDRRGDVVRGRSDGVPSIEQLEAVHVLTHEAVHTSGVKSESLTECKAVQRDAQMARLLGASDAEAKALAWIYWRTIYPQMPDDYTPAKTLGQAIWQITLADVSMSLDNVLAVAGAAREHPLILIFGLGLSIALMGFAASFIANVLQRHRWIAYVGLLIILYVAFDMCYRGTQEVWRVANV